MEDGVTAEINEEKSVYSLLNTKVFSLEFNRRLEKNQKLTLGIGFSAPGLFDVARTGEKMETSHYLSAKAEEYILSLKLEKGLEAGDFKVLLSDEEDNVLVSESLPSGKKTSIIYDGKEGKIKYEEKSSLYYSVHKLICKYLKGKQRITLQWEFK